MLIVKNCAERSGAIAIRHIKFQGLKNSLNQKNRVQDFVNSHAIFIVIYKIFVKCLVIGDRVGQSE